MLRSNRGTARPHRLILAVLACALALGGTGAVSARSVAADTAIPPLLDLLGTSVGYIGCSQSTGSVEGYHEIGGARFWPTVEYGGGSVSRWADPTANGEYWARFDQNMRQRPATTIWWQLCILTGDADANFNDARTVLLQLRQHTAFLSQIYVSAQNGYVAPHVCGMGPPNAEAIAQEVADRLTALGVLRGPMMSDLRGPDSNGFGPNETTDGCHPNGIGRTKLGANLRAFFG